MYDQKNEVQLINDPEDNYKKGYIKLYRSIENHWITSNPYYYLAFNKLLLRVNHSDNSFIIDGQLVECKRGQALYSLNSWSDIFNHNLAKRYWTIQKVRTFFKLLEKDLIIEIQGLRKTTRVTICKYEDYQNEQHSDNKQITSRKHSENIQKTFRKQQLKNDNNEKNDNIINIVKYLNQIANKNFKHSTAKTVSQINARFKDGFTIEDFKKVIDIKTNQWKNTEYSKYLRPETLFGTKFESYLNESSQEPKLNGKRMKYKFFGSPYKYCPIEDWPQIKETYGIQIIEYSEV